jgi:hypothetical protein
VTADDVLDEVERTAGRGVVGVGHPQRPVGAVEDLAVADEAPPDPVEHRSGRDVLESCGAGHRSTFPAGVTSVGYTAATGDG